MLLSLLLTGLLAAEAAQAPQGTPTREAAIEMAESGDYKAALAAFRRIASANPRDHHARLWIAYLHVRMNHPELAETVFRSVMFEDHGNVPARLGLADTLMSLGQPEAALDVLDQAEKDAPEDPEVLSTIGRAHRAAGNTTLSLGYLQRAVMISPTVENRLELEQTRSLYDHRVASTTFFEGFNQDVSDTRNSDISANVRLSDVLRISGRGQYQRKFGITDQRGGVGLEWRQSRRTTWLTQALLGPGNDVLPRTDATVAVGHMEGATEWTLGYRFVEFSDARASVLSPGVTWWPSGQFSIGLNYHAAVTGFDQGTQNVISHSASLRGSMQVYPRVWLNAGYSYGIENLETLSRDRLEDNFRAKTAVGGLQFDMPTMTSLVGQYEYQMREDNVKMGRFTIAVVQRF